MTDQERNDAMNEARVFAIAAPVILPMIEKRKRIAFEQLMSAHAQGRTDTVTLVATLAAFTTLEQEIKQKEAQLNYNVEKKK